MCEVHGLPRLLSGKESACNAGDPRNAGSILGCRRSPGEGSGTPLQYSCLENSTDRGNWYATVRGVTKESDMTEHAWSIHHILQEARFLPFWTGITAGNSADWLCASHTTPLLLPSLHHYSFSEITGGFDQLPKALNASLKPGTIHLGSKVEKVVRDGPEVRISYRRRETNSTLRTLTADFVIISASAKATRLITFEPPLSQDKMDALRSVHYTSATKVVLACNESFWERDGIQGGVSITDLPSRYIYYPSHHLPSGKGVLLASYTVDKDSLFFISMQQDQVVDIVLRDLAAVHQIPKEELRRMCPSSVVKRWSLDPLFMGAFTEFTPYQFVDYSQQLFQPEGRIHFAGEHTCLPHAWIDTAIKSGLQVAKNIQAAVDKEITERQNSSPTVTIISNPKRNPWGNLAGSSLWGGSWRQRPWRDFSVSFPGPQTESSKYQTKTPAGSSSPFLLLSPASPWEGSAESGYLERQRKKNQGWKY